MLSLFKLTWVEIKLFLREPVTVIFTLALPVVFLVVMGGVFGDEAQVGYFRDVGAMDYYMPAYLGLVMMSIGTISLPLRLTGYREHGILRRFRASSFSVWAVLGSQLLVSLILIIVGCIVITLCGKVIYDPDWPQEPGLVLAAFIIGSLCFTSFGFFLGSILPTSRAAQGVGLMLFFVMMILGGAGPPPEVMPDALRIVGNITPLHHVIVLLQNPWLGFEWDTGASLITAGIMLVSALLAARFFRWD